MMNLRSSVIFAGRSVFIAALFFVMVMLTGWHTMSLDMSASDFAERIDEQSAYRVVDVNLRKGDSFNGILRKQGVTPANLVSLERALKNKINPRKLSIGTRIVAVVNNDSKNTERLELHLDNGNIVLIESNGGNGYLARITDKPTQKVIVKVSAVATKNDSIYSVAQNLGASATVISNFEKLYNGVANFRKLQPGTKFDIVFERFLDSDGNFLRDGKIIYATLDSGKIHKKAYLLKDAIGNDKYYNETGSLLNEMYFDSPLRVNAMISSKYGMRKHPISGKWKMHKGVDLAVPGGTKVHASAAGEITFVGYNQGYGNYVKLKHEGRYYTLYAHLKGFAPGLKIHQKVKKGQVIGYVGSTGVSTGPHLHYEIIEQQEGGKTKYADPMQRANVETKLVHHDMGLFKKSINDIEVMVSSAPCAFNFRAD